MLERIKLLIIAGLENVLSPWDIFHLKGDDKIMA